jgi:hypothetical protein
LSKIKKARFFREALENLLKEKEIVASLMIGRILASRIEEHLQTLLTGGIDEVLRVAAISGASKRCCVNSSNHEN